MSLLSSAFGIFSSENSESLVQRKPGVNSLLPRKPFLDKTVNCNTPEVHKKQKSNLTIKDSIRTPSPNKTQNLEIDLEDYCSYKRDEEFDDLLPYSQRLEEQHVYGILKSYLENNTPPPSPTSVDLPFEVPSLLSMDNSFNSSFSSETFYDEDESYLKPEDEIDLPMFDMDKL